jgi:NTE family protein
LVFDSLRRIRNGDRGAEANPEPGATAFEPPTVGLALGGGGARGFAHIGVLRTLHAHGIKPEVIVGTSIGAVVGGCYAGGKLDTLETWARSLTRRGILGYLDISLSGAGLIGGSRLAAQIEDALGDTPIESLPIRFAAISTEVGTGHEIWLTRGRAVDAIRASYALPGIFPPVGLDGRWLVDGALVNPVPVSAARVFGARLVIAINLNSDILGRSVSLSGDDGDHRERAQTEKSRRGFGAVFGAERAIKRQFAGSARRPNIPTVMVDAFNIMQDRITRARLAGDPPDVMINPRLGHVGWFDFHRANEAIEAGALATERALDVIHEAMAALAPRPAPITPPVE